jgi:hypothetical protein
MAAGIGVSRWLAKQRVSNQLGNGFAIEIACIEDDIQSLMHPIDLEMFARIETFNGQVRQLHCL